MVLYPYYDRTRDIRSAVTYSPLPEGIPEDTLLLIVGQMLVLLEQAVCLIPF